MNQETMEREIDKQEKDGYVKGAGLDEPHGNNTVLQSESDLPETDELEGIHEEEEHNHIDYTQYSKEQLASVVKDLTKETDLKKVDLVLREVKPVIDELKERDRTVALNRFILDGGSPDDFDYRGDDLTTDIEATIKQLKDKRSQLLRGQEEQKNENLKKKLDLLEKLRELVDAQEGANQFDIFKDIQKEWRAIGTVPGTQARTLWANYHALVDRFYDNQSIYFELKELDRKRNLEAKLELCARAEKLVEVEKIKDAIRELNELHHEFKHIGPVPLEDKEVVWQRFKSASDAVYARRDEFVKSLQTELTANLDLKAKLCEEVMAFAAIQTDRIKEWNQKTKEILELQKKWEGIGGLPRSKSKEVNKKFWTAFKTFFSNKSAFFKKLDEERDSNLQKKNALVQRALELKESNEWEKTSNELKNLQQQWKEVGPVPEKLRDKVFKEFKEACDYFFAQKREHQGHQENEQVENLKQKVAICEALEQHINAQTATPEILKELEEKFNEICFVPRKDVGNIRNRYHEAVQKFTASIQGISDMEKSQLVLESRLADLKNDPMAGQKIYHKEQAIRKKITKVENDIAVWKNNLEFFGRSKNAEKYKEEFNDKINEASNSLRQLKQQLKLLRTVS
jgi:hypothetical protein